MPHLPARHQGWIAPLLVLIAGVAVLAAVIMLRPQPPAAPDQPSYLPPVSVVSPSMVAEHPRVETTGRVTSRFQINLVAQVSGEVSSVSENFRASASFAEGELLLQLDDTDYLAQLAQAQANLATAQQQLASEQGLARQAQREWRDLGNAQANSLFLREPQLTAAEAQIEAAEAALERARIDLQRTRITAPFDGVVVAVNANLGQYVNPGTALASLNSTAELQVETALSTAELTALGWNRQTGSLAQLPNASLTGSQLVEPLSARISHISPRLDSMTQLTPVLLDVQDKGGIQLSPGQFIQVQLKGPIRENLAWVAETALYERAFVLTANGGEIALAPVEILARESGRLLLAGLREGDQVIVERPLWVFPGQQVEPVPVD